MKTCKVEGCHEKVHAKGYCSRHYAKYRRRRRKKPPGPPAPRGSKLAAERLRALQRELKKAEQMYRVTVSYKGRVRWKREMDAVKSAIGKAKTELRAKPA